MVKTLAYLDRRFGGTRQYLIDHGFPKEHFAELREQLTEDAERTNGQS
jgi:hypothetical protein